MSDPSTFDVLIIGSGAAGLSLALHLAETVHVGLLSKGPLVSGSTARAQGGIAAVHPTTASAHGDTVTSHIEDTLATGSGLCDPEAVSLVIHGAQEAIQWLIDLGVPFAKAQGPHAPYHLVQEGGHTHRRIFHVDDATGHAIASTLALHAQKHPNIHILEEYTAIDLLIKEQTCSGLYALHAPSKSVKTLLARSTVLATGGASKAYLYTSNPDSSSGDGIAMAYRAGCEIRDLEFHQFHPTCLYHPHAKSFLISEALRGEGGQLLLPDGSRFMDNFDERGELAPRDIVARAIDHELKRLGIDCVYLDISHRDAASIRAHFPNIATRCLQYGIDITREPIPIVPAAHYTCGGVHTDLNGRTNITQLYAIGEVAHTGLHGANRLASNSLLECLVFAKQASASIQKHMTHHARPTAVPAWDESQVSRSKEKIVVNHNWDELRRTMWSYVGIVRSDARLHQAQQRIALLKKEVDDYYARYRISKDLLELRNLVQVAELIIDAALKREKNCGLHYNRDRH